MHIPKTTTDVLSPAEGAEGLRFDPVLLGMAKPIYVPMPFATARGIVNMTALAAAQANGLKVG